MRILRRRSVLVGLLALVIAGTTMACLPGAGPHTLTRFDPDRIARLEVDMWKAYYAQERVRLFGLLIVTLREQYGYSWARATQAAFYLARSASSFSTMRGDYDRVLPDIETAYTIARDWTSAAFDPRAVARSELAWWVARRMPSESSVEIVGSRIAESYALIYDVPLDRVSKAGFLRAEAAHLRDRDAKAPDWERIGALLQESFRSLKAAVASPPSS